MHEIDRLVAQLAATQHGTFRGEQVDGLTPAMVRARLRSGRWLQLRRGTFAVGGCPDTWERRLWCALHAAGPGSVVGRRAAARLHGLPGAVQAFVDVIQPEASVPQAKPRTSRRTSLLPAHHRTTVAGFPVTTIERTLFDLAAMASPARRRRGMPHLTEERVARMVDDALVRGRTTTADLSATFLDLAGRGRGGTRLMRQILDERSDGRPVTESELEDLFVRFVEAHRLPQPRRQVVLGGGEGPIGRVDFLYDTASLVVEVDGRRYHDQRAAASADRARDMELVAAGWRVVRVDWWRLVRDGARLADQLRSILSRTGANQKQQP